MAKSSLFEGLPIRLVKVSFLCVVASLLLSSPLIFSEAIIQGYNSDKVLDRGTVVALDETDASKVVPAGSADLKKMYGVVVDPNDAPVTITQEGQKVFVATTGRYQVIVSLQNGGIGVNDYVSMSSIDGIAAKATEKQAYVLGKATQVFDGKTNAISDSGGNPLGRILVDIQVVKSPILKADRNLLPDFLRRAGESVAGKQVSNARLYSALALIIVSAAVAGALLYAGVRSAMISVGRNPLGRKSIFRSLLQVVVFSLIVFITGIIGVYLLLRL